MAKALDLLKKNKTVEERATAFVESIQRNIQRDVLDTLKSKIDGINDKLFELSDFSLQTNQNAGLQALTREQAESRLKEIINLKYELGLIEAELKIKQAAFDELFTDDDSQEKDYTVTTSA